MEQALNDIIVAGELEVRTRGSLPGLKYIAAKSALRTDINPRYVIEIRSIAALDEFIGFHSRAEIRLHALDLLCMKEIIIHAANYETDGDFELARASTATRVLAHHQERVEEGGGEASQQVKKLRARWV